MFGAATSRKASGQSSSATRKGHFRGQLATIGPPGDLPLPYGAAPSGYPTEAPALISLTIRFKYFLSDRPWDARPARALYGPPTPSDRLCPAQLGATSAALSLAR